MNITTKMQRTFWLSFIGEEGHRGCCVIDVTDEEATRLKPMLDAMFPQHADGAEWMFVAQQKAWAYDCNPGGEVGLYELPTDAPMPRNTLLTGELLAQWATRPVSQ